MPDTAARHHRLGIIFGLIAGVGWGTTYVAARWLVHFRELPPEVVVFFRFGFAVPLLWIASAFAARSTTPLKRRHIPHIVILALLGTVLMANSGFHAARLTTNANVTLIINSNAILIAVIAFFMGAAVPARQWLGIVVGLAGVALIGFAVPAGSEIVSTRSHLFGIALACLASLSWALYTVLGRPLVAEYGGLRLTTWCVTIGAAVQALLALRAGLIPTLPKLTLGEWAAFAYLATLPTSIAYVCWFVALRWVSLTTLGPTQYIGNVVGVLAGWLLLDEKIAPAHYFGGALIFIGLHYAVRSASPAPKDPRAPVAP